MTETEANGDTPDENIVDALDRLTVAVVALALQQRSERDTSYGDAKMDTGMYIRDARRIADSL